MTRAAPLSLELYLVRHAVAAERGPLYPDDAGRPLTAEGIEKWRSCVAGLRQFGLVVDLVLTSPFARALETADILADGLRPRPVLATVDALAPGQRFADLMASVVGHVEASRRTSRLALVGHEPDLGDVAARLLGARGAIEFKKGAVCRIDVDRAMPGGPGTLRWFMTSRALRGLAP